MRRLPALVLIAVAVPLVACSSSSPGTHVSPIPAVNATAVPGLPTTANALPDVTPDQVKALLTRLHGTPVVVSVWGAWCGPCREDGPKLAEAARRYGRRIQFLGLDVKEPLRSAAESFIREMGWTYPSLFDPTPNADTEGALGFYAQPVTIFYDRAGHQADQVSGPLTDASLAAGIGKILG